MTQTSNIVELQQYIAHLRNDLEQAETELRKLVAECTHNDRIPGKIVFRLGDSSLDVPCWVCTNCEQRFILKRKKARR